MSAYAFNMRETFQFERGEEGLPRSRLMELQYRFAQNFDKFIIILGSQRRAENLTSNLELF